MVGHFSRTRQEKSLIFGPSDLAGVEAGRVRLITDEENPLPSFGRLWRAADRDNDGASLLDGEGPPNGRCWTASTFFGLPKLSRETREGRELLDERSSFGRP